MELDDIRYIANAHGLADPRDIENIVLELCNHIERLESLIDGKEDKHEEDSDGVATHRMLKGRMWGPA